MISFEEGYAQIAALASALESEEITIEHANNRVLARPARAERDQPSQDISAMDGFALAGDAESYEIIGEIAAGDIWYGKIEERQAVRIFTGAPIPEGADRVLIQENAILEGAKLIAKPIPDIGRNIRQKGSDFFQNFEIEAPRRLGSSDIALLAAMNLANIHVTRQPRALILATGNELVEAGKADKPNDVIASNSYGLKSLIERLGGKAQIAPIVRDDPKLLTQILIDATDYDLIVTTGGASVGKYDFTAESAQSAGFELALQKIALRPGKPIMAGKRGNQIFLGLPGNPVSALICAHVFLRAVLLGLQGLPNEMPDLINAKLKTPLDKNGDRTHFMRAFVTTQTNHFEIDVFENQDSALLTRLAAANALTFRPPHDPKKSAGDSIQFLFI